MSFQSQGWSDVSLALFVAGLAVLWTNPILEGNSSDRLKEWAREWERERDILSLWCLYLQRHPHPWLSGNWASKFQFKLDWVTFTENQKMLEFYILIILSNDSHRPILGTQHNLLTIQSLMNVWLFPNSPVTNGLVGRTFMGSSSSTCVQLSR